MRRAKRSLFATVKPRWRRAVWHFSFPRAPKVTVRNLNFLKINKSAKSLNIQQLCFHKMASWFKIFYLSVQKLICVCIGLFAFSDILVSSGCVCCSDKGRHGEQVSKTDILHNFKDVFNVRASFCYVLSLWIFSRDC